MRDITKTLEKSSRMAMERGKDDVFIRLENGCDDSDFDLLTGEDPQEEPQSRKADNELWMMVKILFVLGLAIFLFVAFLSRKTMTDNTVIVDGNHAYQVLENDTEVFGFQKHTCVTNELKLWRHDGIEEITGFED